MWSCVGGHLGVFFASELLASKTPVANTKLIKPKSVDGDGFFGGWICYSVWTETWYSASPVLLTLQQLKVDAV